MVPKKLLLDYFGQADGGPSVRLALAGDASYSRSNMRLEGEGGGDCGGDCGAGMCDLGRVGAPGASLRQVSGDCGCGYPPRR